MRAMIPFNLHRRIPVIRTPFDARDAAMAENVRLRAKLAEAERALASRKTQDLKTAYTHQVDRTTSPGATLDTMSTSIGGDFDYVGRTELAVLKRYGLRPDHHLVDVGCGSGRLALPLSSYLTGRYTGFDVVDRLVDYARDLVRRPDWRFETVDHIHIPEADGRADMVCFFSVLTHLLHEQSYWYLEEARRVVRPGGTIVLSFLEFAEPGHWPIFTRVLDIEKRPDVADPLTVFIERSTLRTWAERLGLEVVEMLDGAHDVEGALHMGQSVCALRRPA